MPPLHRAMSAPNHLRLSNDPARCSGAKTKRFSFNRRPAAALLGLVVSLGCTSAQAASASEVLPACKLYLSVVDKHGAVSQSEIPHLLDAGECLGAVYAM